MVDYPVTFETEAEAEKDSDNWTARTGGKGLEMSVPEEFGGESDKPSPETVYTMAIENCLLATFKTVAERKNLEFETIKSESSAVLDRNKEGRPEIKSAEVNITVTGVEDKEKADKVKKATLKNCFIHRSVKTDIQSEFNFQ